MSTGRIFIAIDISAEARRSCAGHIDRLRTRFTNVRIGWERPEKLHVTLRFLGEMDGGILRRLEKSIESVAGEYGPFTLRLSETGVFPSRSRPRILWIGVEDEGRSISALHRSIDALCTELGFEGEKREFRPHLTIARLREPHRAVAAAEEHLRTLI